MGAHFHHPCLNGTWDELDSFRAERSIQVWASDAHGEPLKGLEPPSRLALVVGNEGGGLTSLPRERADRFVALPIASTVDSLNVAVAAGKRLNEHSR